MIFSHTGPFNAPTTSQLTTEWLSCATFSKNWYVTYHKTRVKSLSKITISTVMWVFEVIISNFYSLREVRTLWCGQNIQQWMLDFSRQSNMLYIDIHNIIFEHSSIFGKISSVFDGWPTDVLCISKGPVLFLLSVCTTRWVHGVCITLGHVSTQLCFQYLRTSWLPCPLSGCSPLCPGKSRLVVQNTKFV